MDSCLSSAAQSLLGARLPPASAQGRRAACPEPTVGLQDHPTPSRFSPAEHQKHEHRGKLLPTQSWRGLGGLTCGCRDVHLPREAGRGCSAFGSGW